MSTGSPLLVRRQADITLEIFEQIAWEGRGLLLHPQLLHDLAVSRKRMLDSLTDGRAVYGITTGMGYLAHVTLREEEQQRHQANLLLGRAVGGPPFLGRSEARAVLLARLVGFLSGHAGVTSHLCEFLVDRLNDDFVPAIPGTGSGSAGEIIPLAHAFQTFIGVGQVLRPDGGLCKAEVALGDRGIEPYQPGTKEGIALLAGSPATLALTVAHRRTARVLARQLLVAAACAIDALRAPLTAYDPVIAGLANDPVMQLLLERLAQLLAGSHVDRLHTQAPVSYRVIPQVLTHLNRVIDRLEEDIHRALTAVTDSPAFVGGQFITTGGFHAIDLVSDMDTLGIALVHAAELAGQHIHRLLDHRFSGLSDQLAPLPGPHAGLVVVHKRVVGVINELRRLAAPTTIGLSDTSLGQEDAMTFAFEASQKLLRVEVLVRDVIACELLVARQAWALRPWPAATGLQHYVDHLTSTIPSVERDRPLGEDISSLITLLAGGSLQ